MGGNVFANSNVEKIKKENIEPTISKFIEELTRIFPKAKEQLLKNQTLGSVGKKTESGDIDLALDISFLYDKENPKFDIWQLNEESYNNLFSKIESRSRTASQAQISLRALLEMIADKIEANTEILSVNKKSAGGGSLHFLFPQYCSKTKLVEPNINVQIDLMVGDLDWLKFSYYSDVYSGNVKGLHRTQLMLASFSSKGYTFNHGTGIKNKETNILEATTPEEAVKLLNRIYNFNITAEILSNYFELRPFLEKNCTKDDYFSIVNSYLKILDSTRADIPEDLQEYWISNQQSLELKGKFLPSESKLTKYKVEV